MLTKLSLKNIKSFKNEANLKIAPLTLIYGANSSGKSSLWKFLTTLKVSLSRGSGKNFINFDRSFDFANSKTISFNPNKPSEFSFQFDDLTQSDSFQDHIKTIKKDVEKDIPIFLRSPSNLNDNLKENSGLKFNFTFLNINEHEETDKLEIDDKYKEILKRLSSKESLTAPEKELIKTIEEIQKTNEQLFKTQKEVKQLKKDIASQIKDQSIVLTHLDIFKDDKLFANYQVVTLENAPSRMRVQGRDARAFIAKMQKKSEEEILKKIKEYLPNDFKFEVMYKTSNELREKYFSPTEQKKVIFDLVGPNGPKEIKSTIDNPLKYLFIPKEISTDKFFWEEHFNFLQIIKKIIKKNKTNKGQKEPEIYKKYFEQELFDSQSYYEINKGLDTSKMPEIQKTYNNMLEVMCAPLDKFCKIMSEDMRTCILEGDAFLPKGKFYGGDIYSSVFRTLVDGFVDVAMENDIEDVANNFNITNDEAIEFLISYGNFTKYSYSTQVSKLFRFSKDLRNYIEHGDIDRRPGMGMGARFHPRLVTSTLHNTPEHRKRIIELLEKINLPFNIETQSDRDGEIKVSFTNKKISNSQKDIPIEQSGNALKSIIVLLNELALSENRTLIIEEPENKIHPNIQGNLIELIVEIIKENSNNIIIETHSEHFILRIQKLIREKKLDPNFVSINYIYLDDNGEGSKIDHMYLNEDGKFKNKWRHGFFNERLKEI